MKTLSYKRITTSILGCLLLFNLFGQRDFSTTVLSPDKKISLKFNITDGKPSYSISYTDSVLIMNSPMGLVCDDEDFSQNMKIAFIAPLKDVTDNYTMLYGKQLKYSYQAKKQVFQLKSKSGKILDIVFQVSNDGVAYRYYFPEKTGKRKINSEASGFNFVSGTKAWIQPMSPAKGGWASTQPSYEEYYVQNTTIDKLPDNKPGWVYPALFNKNKFWLLISETASYRDYCATRLLHQEGSNNFKIGFPDPREAFPNGGVNPESNLPWYTPWRIVTVGNSLSAITASTLGTDLAKPAVAGDFSYVKPGRASWSWVLLKDDSTTYNVQKRFIDYAAQMGWEYCLVDALWDKQIGNEKIAKLAAYAKSKKVGLLLWYNSAGNWNTTYQGPKDRLINASDRRKEFEWLQKIGVKGVKVDFFGGDGQSMMTYYLDILEDAAKYKLMVNFHGCTLPRGWQRTYPNLVSMEAVRGFENVTFQQSEADKQANQCCVVPFTRNVFDPMDYTPMCFSEVPNIIRRTSNAFELALPYIFHSGITHLAETPSGMAAAPKYVRDMLKKLPVAWDESHLVDGFPGQYVVMASCAKGTWYISGINSTEQNKEITLRLPFVKASAGTLITDGSSNRSFIQKPVKLGANQTLTVTIKPNGGFVIIF
jgi:hypothetical protein